MLSEKLTIGSVFTAAMKLLRLNRSSEQPSSYIGRSVVALWQLKPDQLTAAYRKRGSRARSTHVGRREGYLSLVAFRCFATLVLWTSLNSAYSHVSISYQLYTGPPLLLGVSSLQVRFCKFKRLNHQYKTAPLLR